MTNIFLTYSLRGLAAALTLAPAMAQETTRVSVNSAGMQSNGECRYAPSLSADGRFVAFESRAKDLVPGDTNSLEDVFVHDRQTGLTTRVSVDSAGAQAMGRSFAPVISADGRIVAFHSGAPALVPGDTNGVWDVFVHDRATGLTTRVSVSSTGAQGSDHSQYAQISADGRYVAFHSQADDLVPGDTNGSYDVFVHDRLSSLTTRVSVMTGGGQGNHNSFPWSLSADGRYVSFGSDASNLVPGDTNGATDAFLHDRWIGLTRRVGLDASGAQAPGGSDLPFLSADGSVVAFTSISPLVPEDTNGVADAYVRNLARGTLTRVSVDSAGLQGNLGSYTRSLSGNGRFVAFSSLANNLVPGDLNAADDVFVHNVHTGETVLCSRDTAGVHGDQASYGGQVSANGAVVAFLSRADNLVPGDTNGKMDAFVFEHPINPGLARSGSCPGSITLTITGATPLNPVAIVYGPAGVFVKQAPPCQGMVLGVSPPALGTVITTGGAGFYQLQFNAPPALCGRSVQAADMVSCTASNVIVL